MLFGFASRVSLFSPVLVGKGLPALTSDSHPLLSPSAGVRHLSGLGRVQTQQVS